MFMFLLNENILNGLDWCLGFYTNNYLTRVESEIERERDTHTQRERERERIEREAERENGEGE